MLITNSPWPQHTNADQNVNGEERRKKHVRDQKTSGERVGEGREPKAGRIGAATAAFHGCDGRDWTPHMAPSTARVAERVEAELRFRDEWERFEVCRCASEESIDAG